MLILVTLSVVFFVKYFGKTQDIEKIRMEVLTRKGYNIENNPVWINDALRVEDAELGVDGKETAKILKIDSYNQGDEKFKVYLVVSVSGIKDKKSGVFSYKGRPLVVGETIELVLPKIKLTGLVTHVGGGSELKRQKLLVEARWKSRDPWVVGAINVGDRVINFGSNGVIAEVTNKKTEEPSSDVYSVVEKGLVLLNKDPKKKDMTIGLKLTVENDSGLWIYAGHQKVKIGDPLWIYTNSVDMEGIEVMSIKPVND